MYVCVRVCVCVCVLNKKCPFPLIYRPLKSVDFAHTPEAISRLLKMDTHQTHVEKARWQPRKKCPCFFEQILEAHKMATTQPYTSHL